jgi:hypothetical protein
MVILAAEINGLFLKAGSGAVGFLRVRTIGICGQYVELKCLKFIASLSLRRATLSKPLSSCLFLDSAAVSESGAHSQWLDECCKNTKTLILKGYLLLAIVKL